MKITVNTHTVFMFPTGLILNRFTAKILRRRLKKAGILLTSKHTSLFLKELKLYKKKHTAWKLAEVNEKNGYSVNIYI